MQRQKQPMAVEHVIFVRCYGQTYIASSRGKTASCTAGREQAARRLAEKLMGSRPYTFEKLFEGNDRAYLVVAENGR